MLQESDSNEILLDSLCFMTGQHSIWKVLWTDITAEFGVVSSLKKLSNIQRRNQGWSVMRRDDWSNHGAFLSSFRKQPQWAVHIWKFSKQYAIPHFPCQDSARWSVPTFSSFSLFLVSSLFLFLPPLFIYFFSPFFLFLTSFLCSSPLSFLSLPFSIPSCFFSSVSLLIPFLLCSFVFHNLPSSLCFLSLNIIFFYSLSPV